MRHESHHPLDGHLYCSKTNRPGQPSLRAQDQAEEMRCDSKCGDQAQSCDRPIRLAEDNLKSHHFTISTNLHLARYRCCACIYPGSAPRGSRMSAGCRSIWHLKNGIGETHTNVPAYRLVHKRHQLRPGCLEEDREALLSVRPFSLVTSILMLAFSLVIDNASEAFEKSYHG